MNATNSIGGNGGVGGKINCSAKDVGGEHHSRILKTHQHHTWEWGEPVEKNLGKGRKGVSREPRDEEQSLGPVKVTGGK